MPQQNIINQVVDRVNDFNRRVRDLEEKIRNLSARVNTLDDTIMNKTESNSEDIQELENDVNELSDRVANLEVDIKNINREKRKFVTSQELDEIENYMNLMNPINSSFMTEKEVREMIEEDYVSKDEVESLVEKKLREQKRENADTDSEVK
ncbi:hypothetical protein ACK3SF_00505 [Candidatus Nanosalina sp. VS9-1]|uniref:hypothetical protein n=1 Tax=Candidatus Nanosalina sp. VS9-1 TaxID=3388566 RepID=UPI0039DFDA48